MKVITAKICTTSTSKEKKKRKRQRGKVASTAYLLFLTQAELQVLENVGILKCPDIPAVF